MILDKSKHYILESLYLAESDDGKSPYVGIPHIHYIIRYLHSKELNLTDEQKIPQLWFWYTNAISAYSKVLFDLRYFFADDEEEAIKYYTDLDIFNKNLKMNINREVKYHFANKNIALENKSYLENYIELLKKMIEGYSNSTDVFNKRFKMAKGESISTKFGDNDYNEKGKLKVKHSQLAYYLAQKFPELTHVERFEIAKTHFCLENGNEFDNYKSFKSSSYQLPKDTNRYERSIEKHLKEQGVCESPKGGKK